ncbi:MAG: hypothetical protein JWQ69_4631 [Pseudomonas sp.]|nr:hypothetical protein [Pseudomonas sp.]
MQALLLQILLLIVGWAVMMVGMHFCLTRPSDNDLEQASLLPFADDPEAARNMSRATGKVCERVVVIPTEDEVKNAPVDYIEA